MFKIKIFIFFMHNLNFKINIDFYINVSKFAQNFATIQFQIINFIRAKIFIFYNLFFFNIIQKKYLIYKKKLCVFTKLITKYEYFCKNFLKKIIIHTNHKFLTRFFVFLIHKNIYKH